MPDNLAFATGNLVTVTHIDRLALSTFDLISIVKRIVGGFRDHGERPPPARFGIRRSHETAQPAKYSGGPGRAQRKSDPWPRPVFTHLPQRAFTEGFAGLSVLAVYATLTVPPKRETTTRYRKRGPAGHGAPYKEILWCARRGITLQLRSAECPPSPAPLIAASDLYSSTAQSWRY
jgi:hypothetical protein